MEPEPEVPDVGMAVGTAVIQRLLFELGQQRATGGSGGDRLVGVEAVIALARCGCTCRSWLRAVVPRLVLLLSQVFGARTCVAAARALGGFVRVLRPSSRLPCLIVGSDALPPLLALVQHSDPLLAAAGAELANELAHDHDDRSDTWDWRLRALQLLPSLTTDVADAAAAAGAWPVQVRTHRPALQPNHGGLCVLDIRTDAFTAPPVDEDPRGEGVVVEVYRQLVLGVWEPDGFRESEFLVTAEPGADLLSWYTRTAAAALSPTNNDRKKKHVI